MRPHDSTTTPHAQRETPSDRIAALEREVNETRGQLQEALGALETKQNEASTGSWEYDIAAGQMLWSPRIRDMLAITHAEHVRDDILARMHSDNIESWQLQLSAAITAGAPIDIEVRLQGDHSRQVWLHILGQLLDGSENTAAPRLIGSAQDITYRKHTELGRIASKERFELALQGLSVGIWDWNLVDKQLFWSSKYKQLLGIKDLSYQPRPTDFELRLHPDDHRIVMEALRNHLQAFETFDCECRLRHEDGHYIWTRLCGVAERNTSGKPIRMVGSADDISTRKHAEQKLFEREARLRNMFEHAVDGLITIDRTGIVQSFNPACERMFGYTASEIVGQNVSRLMPEPVRKEHDQYLRNYLKGPSRAPRIIGVDREVEGRRKDGSLFPLELSVSQFEAGREMLFSGIVRDITSRKQIERMKNEFISVVSHELRTPLTSIRGVLGLLTSGRESALPPRTMELLKIAQRNSELLMALINDILDIEKLESGTMRLSIKAVEVAPLLADAVRANSAYAARFDVMIKLSVEEHLPMALADPDRLIQVISNLLSNAAKFTRPGTVVDVHAGKKGDRIRISVRDHGQGIPDDLKGILFDKFFQADPSNSRERPGTGLGLSIARHFTRLMNGEIDFNSQWGKGATFFVDLPSTQRAADTPTHPSLAAFDDRGVNREVTLRA